MTTIKSGQKRLQLVFDETSETYTTLIEWGKKRGLTPGRAVKVILVDWSDAINGVPNPFALALAGYSPAPQTELSPGGAQPEEISPEEVQRREAALQAAEQFL
jgi:hypothetical protein